MPRRSKSLLCLLISSVGLLGWPLGEVPGQPPFNVGYRVVDLKYPKEGGDKTLTVAVWYPTAAQAKAHTYGGSTSGKVAVEAAPLEQDGP